MKVNLQELLAKMTLTEKIGQLTMSGNSIYNDNESVGWQRLREGKVGSFISIVDPALANRIQKVAVEQTRLGIPVFFSFDVIHGLKTIFPLPLAESCSFNPALAEQTAHIAAKESRASGIHLTFAPMVDTSRDARWGRYNEGAGEDAYVGSRFAEARVRGFQGDDLTRDDRIAACVKHFVAYGACESGMDYNSVDMSSSVLYNHYLPPFRAAAKAGVSAAMNAFVTFNGYPCVGSDYILTILLRDVCGFNGTTISDFASVGELSVHGYTKDDKESAEVALKAGMDIEMEGAYKCYLNHLEELVNEGKVPMEKIDRAVLRVLELKEKLGLFEHPYFDLEAADKVCFTPEHRRVARQAARESLVLLKNEGALPLAKSKKVALIGPLADNVNVCLSVWRAAGVSEDTVSFLDGLRAAGYETVCAKGCYSTNHDLTMLPEAVKLAAEADVIVAAVGEEPYSHFGESGSRASVALPGGQLALLRALKEVGKPLITVINAARPLAIEEAATLSDAVLYAAGGLGTEAGNALADVIAGDYNPDGRLSFTMPTCEGCCPIYYDHFRTGRPALSDDQPFVTKFSDGHALPQYPFGYGLGYSAFRYRDLTVSHTEAEKGDTLTLTVTVDNLGERDGCEVVQLYLSAPTSRPVRPVTELKRFEKVAVPAGESRKVTFTLPVGEMGYYDNHGGYPIAEGEYQLRVAKNALDEGQSAVVTIHNREVK